MAPRTREEEQRVQDFGRRVREAALGPRVRLGNTVYTVEKVLFAPVIGMSTMNDGVYLLKSPEGRLVVEKRLKMSTEERRERAQAEKRALLQFARAGGSANINKLFEAVWERGSMHCSLLLEYCNRGTIDGMIDDHRRRYRQIGEMFCWKVLLELSTALCFSHLGIKDVTRPFDKNPGWSTVCHLDIKPPNVFLDYAGPPFLENMPGIWPRVVLGDFGCAVTKRDIFTKRIDHRLQPFGTPFWFPPDQVENSDGVRTGPFGKFTDIWQMGGLVQVMCRLLVNPEQGLADEMRPAGRAYSAELNEVVAGCMNRVANLRPTALDVATAVKTYMENKYY